MEDRPKRDKPSDVNAAFDSMIRYALATPEGREMIRKAYRATCPLEIAEPLVGLMDGKLSFEQCRQRIQDNALDALNDGRWSQEEVAAVLSHSESPEVIRELKRRERARMHYIWSEVYERSGPTGNNRV